MEVDDHIPAGSIIVVQVNMGLGRGTQLVVRNRFLHTFLDRAVQRFLKQAVLVHFLYEVCRDLARTEAGHTDLRAIFFTSRSMRVSTSLAVMVRR